jgi:Ulp1 family protease
VQADKDAYESIQKNAYESVQKNVRPSRKKKAAFQSDVSEISSGEDNGEPVNKKPKKRGLQPITSTIDLCDSAPKVKVERKLRSRRGKSNNPSSSPIVINDNDDDVTEKEEREMQAAINASLKMCGGKSSKKVENKDDEPAKIDPYADVDKTIELFRYPFTHGIDNELIVKMEDYLCLGKAEYLSDVIIDFILTYIYNEKFTDEMREKVYIFPSSFYTLYSTKADYAGWNSEENANKTALQKRYERVHGMLDTNVNYFDKDFLVFPLFQTNHWFLCIVCYPKLTQNLLFDGTPTDDEAKRNIRHLNEPEFNLVPLKTSCILTFDSIKSNASRKSTAMKHIRNFLTSHHEQYYKDQFPLGKLTSCAILVSFNIYFFFSKKVNCN